MNEPEVTQGDDTAEKQPDDYYDQFTPIERAHLFIWNIYNIIRNVDILKQWHEIKQKQRERMLQEHPLSETSSALVPYNPLSPVQNNRQTDHEEFFNTISKQ